MKTNQKAFEEYSNRYKDQLPFSLHFSWWNEVVKDHWDLTVLNESGETKAIWPYKVRKKGVWKMLCQPAFTPYGGPIIHYPEGQKRERRYSYEQKISKELVEALPYFSELLINCKPDLQNTLPFIWEGFEDRKKYTYILDLNSKEDELWNGLRENIRRQIRKAEKEITISRSENAKAMGELLRESFNKKEAAYPIEDESIYQRIQDYLAKYDCGEFIEARDDNGELHAMMVWIHDAQSAYYLIGGSATAYKNSGAMSLLMWESIKKSKLKGIPQFNFEGSMIPSVEKYLRGFGGKLTPYSCLIKNKSKSLKVLRKLKN